MWTRRRPDRLLAGLAVLLIGAAASGQTVTSTLEVLGPPPPLPGQSALPEDVLLQLEVFLNDRPLYLISAFTLKVDGRLYSSFAELDEIGLIIPETLQGELEIPLDRLPGVTYVYDEAAQAIHLIATAEALRPTRISGRVAAQTPDPVRPPPGMILNYSLYASAEREAAFTFDGFSAAVESRIFGHFGTLENSGVVRFGSRTSGFLRLDSSFVSEDVAGLRVFRAGDLISGGFAWTRPIRMAGVQLRRSFDLRPDLVTLPIPQFSGSAAAPSTVDLYVNNVRTLSAEVPQGSFVIDHPPIIYGAGAARIVVRDAAGRERVTSAAFYASPDLLAPGLTDFSIEAGLARRNYASASFDYDHRPAASVSWRRGMSDHLTLEAHAETVGSLMLLGGGGVFTLGNLGLLSVAGAGSRTSEGTGALIDIGLESRLPSLTVSLRTLRTFGDYEDIASWTAVLPPDVKGDRRVFGQPRELDQALVSMPLPWSGGSVGASYVYSEREEERSRIVSLSLSQDFGRLSLFASAFRDFEQAGSTGLFLGLSLPLGRGVTATAGASHNRSDTSGYVGFARQGHHEPGQLGWLVRAAAGERQEAEAILRYGARFAQFEAGVLHSEGVTSAHGLMEGAVTWIGGGLHTTRRIDQSFALVDAGAPGVTVLHENRSAGVTDRRGQLLVPNLTAFAGNRIALDPTGLPIDAAVSSTSANVTPYDRVGVLVDFEVETDTNSALVALVDIEGAPLELGSRVEVDGQTESYVVGYDGEVYLNGLERHNVLVVTTPDRGQCHARFTYQPIAGEQVRIADVRCQPGETKQ